MRLLLGFGVQFGRRARGEEALPSALDFLRWNGTGSDIFLTLCLQRCSTAALAEEDNNGVDLSAVMIYGAERS